MEMLVALAVTSMLVALLMGSLYYGTRIQAGLADELGLRESTLRQSEWFAGTLRSCLPEDTESGARFVATPHEISCTTVTPLQARALPSPQRIRWLLRKSSDDSHVMELVYQDVDQGGNKELVVRRFTAEEAVFQFSGVDGQVRSGWPVAENAPETLPRLVYLSLTSGGKQVVAEVASVLADPWLLQELKNPFGLELPQ
ncbi:MAG: type II secretion system protein [Ramlibacter sp.]|nr:type II secretion system protein [Ramlibacter sp.]